MENFRNLEIDDLEGEIWVDVIDYDGIYEVSNKGRVKSLQREVNGRWGTRLVKERILTQSIRIFRGNRIDGLIVNINGKSHNVPPLIFKSFYRGEDFGEKECVMHVNKNPLDNNLSNLKKVTRKTSKKTDMVRSIRTVIATPKNLNKAQIAISEKYNSRTHKKCVVCKKVDTLNYFSVGRNTCKVCTNKIRKEKRNADVKTGDIKKCNRCSEEKKDYDFPKYDGTCKKCRAEIMMEWKRTKKHP